MRDDEGEKILCKSKSHGEGGGETEGVCEGGWRRERKRCYEMEKRGPVKDSKTRNLY